MMEGWLIYRRSDADKNKDYITWMQAEAHQLGIHLPLVLREDIACGICSGQLHVSWNGHRQDALPRFAIVRTIDPMLSAQLEALGVQTFNSSNVARLCNNKAETYFWMRQLGVPMLDTWTLRTGDDLSVLPDLKFPVVVKTVEGRGGSEVQRVDALSDWVHFSERFRDRTTVVQPLGPVPGRDVRVFVVGREIVGAVLRKSDTDFRANFSLGGQVELYALTASQRALVDKIIRQLDFGMVGIDFLFDDHGEFLFNEIEDVVGSRTLSLVQPDANIVRRYLTHIRLQIGDRELGTGEETGW